jgi:hydroxymethylpyrimidine/phosphomethylpyrimidine kinase
MIRTVRPRKTSSRGRAVSVVLTIAGSDSSGGAGIQADLKTFAALGVYGASAVTCVVAEHPGRVLRVTPLAPARVVEQILAVLEAFPVAAIKTGMLGSRAIIEAVEKAIGPALDAGVPLVVDPVMMASAGGSLLKKTALPALRHLIARATLVTPNRDETARLSGRPIDNLRTMRAAALALAKDFRGPHVLAKGGHLRSGEAVDLLVSPDGIITRFAAPRIRGIDPHGTGCTYSAAIAAGLAWGLPMREAVTLGKRFITRALEGRLKIGRYEVLNHFQKDMPQKAETFRRLSDGKMFG